MTLPESNNKIHRDVENGMISGVCAGVANYFSIDAVWIRAAAIFGLIFLSIPVLLAYVIAVVLLPRRII
ncbi:PspC domain-containing protein [Alteromonas sp. C1M14]|uniref:PspC domain-containing protein n=1 Tax=Alteromonas sp. C1M14 TaxID=2841567 RepID=UPI001C099520|nr:PspC domain-containing protein [Alteromonas sp. C1M14]MBU2976613.1 PspC domain-containing protein [Alteromonas sp. C1M14]